MDIALLAKDAVTLLAPALPYLVTAGNEAIKEVGKKIGGDALDYAKTLWAKLRAKPALQSAISDVVAAPADEDAQAQLRIQLKKLLADDEGFASELESILGEAKKAGVSVIVSGDHSIGIGGNVSGSTLIAGDKKDE